MTSEEYIKREQEIQEATTKYPEMEMGEAYRKYKEEKGEVATQVAFGSLEIEAVKEGLKTLAKAFKSCPSCGGQMELESICGGCVEGRMGYKSKFTCTTCLHRELSKKDYLEWLKELSLSSKD
jgi:hypothetical protein